jgi:SAM-dependent methyltransferase
VSPPCPRCGAPSTGWARPRDRTGGRPAELRRCLGAGCGVGFTWPPPPPAPAVPSWAPTGLIGRAVRAALGAELRPLREACLPPAAVVDVGAGAAVRAAAAAAEGYSVTAVEPDPEEAARARARLGPERVVEATLEEAASAAPEADAALAWHVLEHLEDLDAGLRAIRALLRPGGSLVAALPNAAGLEALVFGDRWHGWEPARHRWHLDAPACARVLRAAGFAAASVRPRGGWRYPSSLAFSLAPGLDPQLRRDRALAGRALVAALVPVAAATAGLGVGPQLVAVARR